MKKLNKKNTTIMLTFIIVTLTTLFVFYGCSKDNDTDNTSKEESEAFISKENSEVCLEESSNIELSEEDSEERSYEIEESSEETIISEGNSYESSNVESLENSSSEIPSDEPSSEDISSKEPESKEESSLESKEESSNVASKDETSKEESSEESSEEPIQETFEWGTRPFEFDPINNNLLAESKIIPGVGLDLIEYNDRYGNTWYGLPGGYILGGGSVFRSGWLTYFIPDVCYLGNGIWANGNLWWTSDNSKLNKMPIITSYPITNPQYGVGNNVNEDFVPGHKFVNWWMTFAQNHYGVCNILQDCYYNTLEEFIIEFRKKLLTLEDFKTEEDLNTVPFTEIEDFYELNIYSMEDLIESLEDPFSYPFSNYRFDFN